MATKTDGDWEFSTYVHKHLAIQEIYEKLNWTLIDVDAAKAKELDINHGIDYTFLDLHGKKITVQERFRDHIYINYSDATLRYRRDFNPDPSRVESEFYKIKADYLVYGITNGKKFADKRDTLTAIVKWAVVDVKFMQEKFRNNEIKIVTPSTTKRCWAEGNVLYSPEILNPDGSSSFLPFDIKLMQNLWGDRLTIAQKGFL